jgi:hypothetical protein
LRINAIVKGRLLHLASFADVSDSIRWAFAARRLGNPEP